MKKTLILGLTAAGFTLGSLTAHAVSDSQYPASDFQPKVIFADKELTAKPAQQTEYDPKYPATSFEPKVVFADPDLIGRTTSMSKAPPAKWNSIRNILLQTFNPKLSIHNCRPGVVKGEPQTCLLQAEVTRQFWYLSPIYR